MYKPGDCDNGEEDAVVAEDEEVTFQYITDALSNEHDDDQFILPPRH